MPYEVTLQGDMRILLRALDPNSVDAIVCDPPYLLGFMGKSWDSTTISYEVETWAECLRVLKPGGYLVAFGATRTSHRITCAIEDAGFEIRDTLQWVFGSGFPKSLDVGKAIDKEAGAVREVIGRATSWNKPDSAAGDVARMNASPGEYNITAPATDLARQWHGYGTALKPAHEPITLARKPMSGTVARNVATWGTGGIDVDGCRVGDASTRMVNAAEMGFHGGNISTSYATGSDAGRWPPNIILGDGAGEVIDGMSGVRKFGTAVLSGVKANGNKHAPTSYRVAIETHPLDRHGYEGVGGASAFFPTFCYTPKASRKEREAGLEEAGIEPMTRADVTGRWPPNIILGDGAGEVIDGMSGVAVSKAAVRRNTGASQSVAKGKEYPRESMGPPRNGGASEFFPTFCYVPKASRKEREAGLEEAGIEPMTRANVTERDEGSAGIDNPRAGTRQRGEIRNTHPTVKPVEIMRWLVRLVSPPRSLNPVILDPFMGSGTTGIACVQEGVSFIGIELDERNYAISEARISHARKTQEVGQHLR